MIVALHVRTERIAPERPPSTQHHNKRGLTFAQAFTIIDQNRDGIISKDDLRDVLASMGEGTARLPPCRV